MKKHNLYCSAMGIEPNPKPRAIARTRIRHREQLEKMVGEYNLEPSEAVQELVTLLRGILDRNK